MSANRSRRQNAGRNMQQLIQQQLSKEGDNDEFYAGIYGGFQEVVYLIFFVVYFDKFRLIRMRILSRHRILQTRMKLIQTLINLKKRITKRKDREIV